MALMEAGKYARMDTWIQKIKTERMTINSRLDSGMLLPFQKLENGDVQHELLLVWSPKR
jgi:hypothetical protein